jgi:hypothetical protein
MAKLNESYLDFVVDKNTSLHGCFTPASHLQIVSPSYVTRDRVDELIVFNYAYIEEIRDAHRQFVEDGGTIKSVLEVMDSGRSL